jgi:PAS domain S-box-containing protein
MIDSRREQFSEAAAGAGAAQSSAGDGGNPAAWVRNLEMTLSGLRDFAYVFDLQGRFLYANKALLDLWGLSLDQAAGKNFFELGYPEELAAKLQRQIQRVIDTRQVLVDETTYTSPAGHVGYYEYIFSAVIAADGSVEAVAGSTRDITDRKLAEESLRRAQSEAWGGAEANAKYRAFFDHGAYFAGLLAPDGTVLEANRLCLEECGFTREEIVGRKFWDCGWWNPSPELMVMVRGGCALAAEGRFLRRESPYFIADGSERCIDFALAPVMNAAGRVLFIAATGTDITHQRTLSDERERLLAAERSAREEAERASHLKDEFLATLSHELRTPLNAILGWTRILSESREEEDLAEGLQTIERNARAQTVIIEDLLDMSRIISGKVRLEVKQIDLASIVHAAVDTTKPAADAKGVRVEMALDLPSGPMSGDGNRLQQVFWNLLTNAIKFTPRGGEVRVSIARVDSHVEVRVADTGEGIAPEFLPHVFDRFRQADASTTRRHGGLGLGLSIVKQLVELHGGSVRVSSGGLGQGAAFIVALPVAALYRESEAGSDRREPAAAPKLGELSSIHGRIRGLRVLVVDDEPDARALIKRLLEGCHASVTTAASAEEAMRLLQDGKFDLLISDIGMPGEDGYSLIRRVRALGPERGGETPAIALTAYARGEDRVKAMTAGFQHHIVKPVEAGELITVIAALSPRRDDSSGETSPGGESAQ